MKTAGVGNPISEEHKRRIAEGQRKRHAAADRGPRTCEGCGRAFKGAFGVNLHLASSQVCREGADGVSGTDGEGGAERGV